MCSTGIAKKLARDNADPANPEKYPDRFLHIRCDTCEKCYYDVKRRRCFSGGPFNVSYEFDPKAAKPIVP